jgi:polar amino acid transport system substrate-binding protein
VISVFRYPDAGLISVITPLTYEPIGVGLPAGDPLLVNWMQNLMNSLEEVGVIEDLTDRWFSSGDWLEQLP